MTKEYQRYARVLLSSFLILSISGAISLIWGYHISNDIASCWPVYLVLLGFIVICYCFIYPLLASNRNAIFSIKYTIIYNSILGMLLILYTYFRYTINVDWLLINEGKTKLSLFETAILSDFAIPGLFALFLITQFVVYLITLFLRKE
jgi:hypothetical protein